MATDKRRILFRLIPALLLTFLVLGAGPVPPPGGYETRFGDTLKADFPACRVDTPYTLVSRLDTGISDPGETGKDRRDNPAGNSGGGPDRRTVRVGIYQNPPKVFIDENGLPAGIFIDLLDEIARIEKWKLVYVPCEWSDCLQALEKHRIDLMPDVAYSRERDSVYDFHETPVVDSWSQVYANSSTRVSTLSDLNGKRVAVLKKGIQEETFAQMMSGFGFEVTLVEVDTYGEAFRLAAGGYVDAVLSNYLIGDYLYRKYGLTKTPIVFNPTSLYFATAQGRNRLLLETIDRHLNEWRRQPDSYYYRTLARWMEKPPEQVVPRYLIWIIAATGGFLVLSVGVIGLLRVQVRAKTGYLVKANESLRKSEEKYRSLVENLNDVIFNLDPQGNITYMSPVAESIFGYRSKEIIGRSFSEYIHTDDLPGVVESRGETLGGVLQPYEFRMIDKNGSIHHVRTSSRPIEKDGQNTGVTGILTDITVERRAEEALRESEQKRRTVLHTIEDGYFEVDLKGSFTSFNESMRKMLGYTQKEIAGLNYRRYMAKEIAEKVFQTFNEIFRTGIPAKTVDWRVTRKDGTTIDLETSISLKHNDSGEPTGFFGIARDITDKKRMELQLLQAEKLSAVGTMISGVAHELNNPLTAIIGNAQLIMRGEAPDDIKNKLEVILKESIRSSKIVGGLLAFAREHKPERNMVNVNDIVIESMNLKEYDLKVNNIDVKVSLSDDVPKTYADPYQIQQVFINLINNARDALADQGGGALVIETYRKDDVIIVEFIDTGPGIPNELVNKIFDPFFTTKEAGKGTGLGLSMAYGIISEHGGTISVESESGGGARFVVTLPITEYADPVVKEIKKPVKIPVGTRSVLVVEDEASLRDLLAEALTEGGFIVDAASTGKAAIDLVGKRKYDAVISDIKMPGIGGKELYLYIREHHPEIAEKMIFITGDVLSKDTQAFLKTTKNRFIEKPFSMDTLIEMINEA
ncbi:MAG: PAS domain S-box protein [Deltaproteobacteria bacterium]|nr:PAS domain S-box protein [Candidatus Zymogenaceae bacterium]